MTKKLRNIIWTLFLLILSFPIGFIFIFAKDVRAFCDELMITLITAGIGMIISLGLISLIIRWILRKTNHKDPTKIALIVYTFFLGCFLLIGAIGFKDAVFFKCEGSLW